MPRRNSSLRFYSTATRLTDQASQNRWHNSSPIHCSVAGSVELGRPRRRSPGKELRVDLGDQRTSFFIRQNGSHLPIQALSPLSGVLVASRCIVRLNKKPTFYRTRCVEAFPGLALGERSTCRQELFGCNFVIAGLERPVHQKGHGEVSNQATLSARKRIHPYPLQQEHVAGSVELGETDEPWPLQSQALKALESLSRSAKSSSCRSAIVF